MRILVITTFYAPDLGPAAPLYAMLCEDLVRLGHQVSVIATVPHYPTGRVAPQYRRGLIQRDECNGVDITRVRVPSLNRARLGQRLLTFVVFQCLCTIAGLRRDYDVVLVGNPALEVFVPFFVLVTLRRKPALFSVHDLYPEVGVRLGIFRHKPVIACIKAVEDYCLRRAACVRATSEGFRKAIQGRGVPLRRIVVVRDWFDPDFIKPLPRDNSFSARWNPDDCFIVLYAGNIGFSQGLETVLRAAALLSNGPKIQFLIVGDGAAKHALKEQAAIKGLANVRFVPFQPRELVPLVLASADISLICLKHGVSAYSVPSKVYSILASARPVVAAVDRRSDTWDLVQTAGCGVCVQPEDPDALAAAILDLSCNKALRDKLGSNGRDYVVANHGRMAAAQQFHEAMEAFAGHTSPAGHAQCAPVASGHGTP